MERSFSKLKSAIDGRHYTWLITGVAGFIGSNLLEQLLKLNQHVVGLDNFSTGHKKNLDEVCSIVSEGQWNNFSFIEGDIRDIGMVESIFERDIDYVLHQAALGSVPRSIESPLVSNDVNISGFLCVLNAAKNKGVKGFVYAASSSTYGDHPALPKVESNIGNPLSPYAVTKLVNEIYADVYFRVYGFKALGLRYFNVFGPRQDPNGAYAAVIPKWTAAMINDENVVINGDGETSRDFCFIDNVVHANILGALGYLDRNEVVNIALGDRSTLNELFVALRNSLSDSNINYNKDPVYKEFRPGDVRHSQADISKIIQLLGYVPDWRLEDGIRMSMPWYLKNCEV